MTFSRFFLPALLLLAPCLSFSQANTSARLKGMAGSKPNIILILVDDMGWGS